MAPISQSVEAPRHSDVRLCRSSTARQQTWDVPHDYEVATIRSRFRVENATGVDAALRARAVDAAVESRRLARDAVVAAGRRPRRSALALPDAEAHRLKNERGALEK